MHAACDAPLVGAEETQNRGRLVAVVLIAVAVLLNGPMGLLMILGGEAVRGVLQLAVAASLAWTGVYLRRNQGRAPRP